MTPPQTSQEDLSEAASAIVMAAVRLARSEGIAPVAQLRSRLKESHPETRDETIAEALRFWGRCESLRPAMIV